MRLNIFKYGVFIFLLFVLGFSVKISSAKVSKGIIVNTINLNENTKSINFDLKYPEVKLKNEQAQNKINILIKENIYEFKKYIEDIYNESLSMYQNTMNFTYEGSSDFEYEIIDNILSIKMSFSQFTGGPHPMVLIKDYNFDLNTGNILKLGDLFNENGKKIYKNVIDGIIKEKINENPDNYFPDEFKGVNENTSYYLTEKGIVIFFQLYEIAPYSSGIIEFKIPYSEFKESLSISI